MRPVSEAFLRTVRGSHVMRSRARVVDAGTTGVNPVGVEIPILGGDVRFESKVTGGATVTGASVRASLDLATEGAGQWPGSATDSLAPFGNEIYAERGIAFGNGVIEWIGLGYYRIYTPEQEEVPDGPIRIAARDRMSGLEDARLTEPRQFTATTTLGTIVTTLVTEVYPGAVIEWDDATDTAQLGRALIAEEDRFEFLSDLITAAGKTWAWDHRGHLMIKSPPDASAPIYDVDAGVNGVLAAMSRDLSREGVYNGVVAFGEAADTEPPVRALVVDDNPESPTYWEGAFGKVPRFYSSPFITTLAQAESAARAILTQSLGVPYNVQFGTVPNPALEPLDVVRVIYPRRSRSLNMRAETHIVDTLTVPLGPAGLMTATTREQLLAPAGG